MRISTIIAGLMVILATSGFCSVLAEDGSLEYNRVTSSDIKWAPIPSMPKGTQTTLLHGNPGKPGLCGWAAFAYRATRRGHACSGPAGQG